MTPDGGEEALLARLSSRLAGNARRGLAVAVSGGGDSLALLHLADLAFPGRVRAVTVDHGLRPDSAAEAAMVAAFCDARRIAHQTLHWTGPAATGNLMDQARTARMALLADWARGQGDTAGTDVPDILLGHTADDQAETLLMNLARTSGLDGLCGLRPQFSSHGVTWHRPLLDVTRAELRACLTARAIPWIDDPSNDNDRFTRTHARRALSALQPLGITAERLVQTARNLSMTREVVLMALARAVDAHVTEVAGSLLFDPTVLGPTRNDALPAEIERRLLIAALRWIGGSPYPPRESQLDRLRGAVDAGRDATLGGLRFRWTAAGLLASREPRAVQAPHACAHYPCAILWDHRWQVSGPVPGGAQVRALGREGVAQCPDWRQFGPREALVVTPSVWCEGRLISAPLAGLPGPCDITLRQSFARFILSH